MRRLSRCLAVTLASLLVISGCGSDVIDQTTSTTAAPAATTRAPDTTTAPIQTTATTVPMSSTTVARPPLIDGLPAPDIALGLDDETTLELAEAYEPVVLFFWATWCHNCHEMMPLIDQMSADHVGRATVVAVARLSGLHEVENDVIEYLPSGATRWVSDDDSAVSEAFRVPGNPVTILVVGGVEVDRWLGSTEVSDIRNRLDEVLALYE
jgi:thiol-disulfide isomerase/thioredoxin